MPKEKKFLAREEFTTLIFSSRFGSFVRFYWRSKISIVKVYSNNLILIGYCHNDIYTGGNTFLVSEFPNVPFDQPMIKILDFGLASKWNTESLVNCRAYDVVAAAYMLNDLLTNGTQKEYLGYWFKDPPDDYFQDEYKPASEDKVIQGIFDLTWTAKGRKGSQEYAMDELLAYIDEQVFVAGYGWTKSASKLNISK
jgi:hypothetical protein